jgi:kinetochore protein Spc7/SPC105
VISLAYRREIELVLDISAFQPTNTRGNANIDLWYIASTREYNPAPCTAERDFYLQCIRDQVRGLPQSATKLSRVLGSVSAAWDQAGEVVRHVRSLNVTFPTTVQKTGDNMAQIRTEVLVVPLRSKVEVMIDLVGMTGGLGDVVVDVNPRARVVYGESFNEKKMGEFLKGRIGLGEGKTEAWGDVVGELHGRLLTKGRKA